MKFSEPTAATGTRLSSDSRFLSVVGSRLTT
jgi:hypothetical protein